MEKAKSKRGQNSHRGVKSLMAVALLLYGANSGVFALEQKAAGTSKD